MTPTIRIAALALAAALVSPTAFAEGKAAATVNGVAIPQARIDMHVQTALAQGQKDTPELRNAIREELINREVVAQEAEKQGLAKEAAVQQQIELARQQVLIGAYMQSVAKKQPITDEALKAEYAKLKMKAGSKEYNARHILVATEAEAKDIIAQLGKKGSFEKLAKEHSKDVGSANNGGSLGWAIPGTFVPEFANALLNLKKGEYTKDPVQSQFGWHVIKLDDMRNLKMPTLEELKPQLQQRLQQQAVQQSIAALREKAKIE